MGSVARAKGTRAPVPPTRATRRLVIFPRENITRGPPLFPLLPTTLASLEEASLTRQAPSGVNPFVPSVPQNGTPTFTVNRILDSYHVRLSPDIKHYLTWLDNSGTIWVKTPAVVYFRCSRLCHDMCSVIKDKVKELQPQDDDDDVSATSRRKLVVHVIVGQDVQQSVRFASRCLWNVDEDCQASETYRNNSLFAVGVVFWLAVGDWSHWLRFYRAMHYSAKSGLGLSSLEFNAPPDTV